MPRTKLADTLKVVFERDGRGWMASVPAVAGCHTQGRSIHEARTRLREALAVSLDGPRAEKVAASVAFEEQFRGASGNLQGALEGIDAARQAAEQLDAARKLWEARAGKVARRFLDEGLSLRDAGELLGVSHEHVKKLAKGVSEPRPYPQSGARGVLTIAERTTARRGGRRRARQP